MSSQQPLRVNAWTEWARLRTVVVGSAHGACFDPLEPAFREPHVHSAAIRAELDWPRGPRKQSAIDAANAELDNLAKVLEGLGVRVLRPTPIDFSAEVKTPQWQVSNGGCCVCPRDVMLTVGRTVLEATMSHRARFFEYLPYRAIVRECWDADAAMRWQAAPKPSMSDAMYWEGFYAKYTGFDALPRAEQAALEADYRYVLNEAEMAFDAADVLRAGHDLFVLHSCTTNRRGIEWLRRELGGQVRIHVVNTPTHHDPTHLDANLVLLRPPSEALEGVALTNPVRPLSDAHQALFRANRWRLVEAPQPCALNDSMPTFCQSSKWLSMNILSVDEKTVITEQSETALHALLESLGFTVVKIPFRNVFEFGGSIHCATWEIEREDANEDYFKIQDVKPPTPPPVVSAETANAEEKSKGKKNKKGKK